MAEDRKTELELTPAQARAACPDTMCRWKSTEDVPPLEGVIGQKRAVRALDFGLGVRRAGYNIFVCGVPGTGRMTTVLKAVNQLAASEPVPDDWCYVYNFESPDRPRALRFPPGTGRRFQADLEQLVDELKQEVPRVFESKEHNESRDQVDKVFQAKRQQLFAELERRAEQEGFQLKPSPAGLVILPLHEGKPMSEADFEKLGAHEKDFYLEKRQKLQAEINEIMRQVRLAERESREKLQELDREAGHFAVRHCFEELNAKYGGFPGVAAHLEMLERKMVDNIQDFTDKEDQEVLPGLRMPAQKPTFLAYQVNLLVDNGSQRGAPVVREANPTYFNLVGRQEHRPQFGSFLTDFTMIKAGALHRASGGYLVLYAKDLFSKYFSWQGLKRCLENNEVQIEDLSEEFHLISTPTHRPEPIPLSAKVIIIGDPYIYQLLSAWDESFGKLFRVKVDFDTRLERDEEGVGKYAGFISGVCREKELLPLDRSAIARVVEHGSRLAGDQRKLTSRFFEISGLVEEADYWARQAGRAMVSAAEIRQALAEKVYRSNRVEERIQEMIVDGQILIDNRGRVAGQVNGLSVLSLGDYDFGRPSRITVRVYTGKEGIVDLERETKMGGPIHSKGVLILAGFLGERFAGKQPLSLSASICFEQSYDGIEGDSASSAELYALLSALSGLPLEQGIAVTGSVNQMGQVQPIGGVNEKIEGFYEVCRQSGFTGRQGVLIPRANIRNLMLKEEVVASLDRGEFRLWAVDTIDQGVEILTGVPAGARNRQGGWPAGTVNGLAAAKLARFNESFREKDEAGARSVKRGRKRVRRAENNNSNRKRQPGAP